MNSPLEELSHKLRATQLTEKEAEADQEHDDPRKNGEDGATDLIWNRCRREESQGVSEQAGHPHRRTKGNSAQESSITSQSQSSSFVVVVVIPEECEPALIQALTCKPTRACQRLGPLPCSDLGRSIHSVYIRDHVGDRGCDHKDEADHRDETDYVEADEDSAGRSLGGGRGEEGRAHIGRP